MGSAAPGSLSENLILPPRYFYLVIGKRGKKLDSGVFLRYQCGAICLIALPCQRSAQFSPDSSKKLRL